MQSKWGLKGKRPEKVDKQRRKVIKLMGAAGAGAIASAGGEQGHQDRHGQPADRTDCCIRRSR